MSGERPSVALFCATYLRPEMLHVHRHILGLRAFDPVVITQKREGDWPAPTVVTVKRSPLRFISRGIERMTGRPWQISGGEARRVLQAAEGAGLMHIFFGSVAFHLLPLMRLATMPIVVSFHGSDVTGAIASDAGGRARGELFRLSRFILCRSGQLAGQVAALGCDPAKIRIMKTVLPDIPFLERPEPADGAWRVVQACRLVSKKGLPTSLKAFAAFRKVYPASRFVIAGEGPMEEELRRQARDLGLAEAVTFTGFLTQKELAALYSESHFFLHPSETVGGDVEGIPNSLLEAMSSGLPAVTTRHGGIPEVIRHLENGWLCDERDDAGLAEALLSLAADRAGRTRIAHAGSDTVREEFSAGRRIAEIEGLYREACGAAV